LDKNILGKTNFQVSKMGLGCWQLGGLTTINNIAMTYGDVNEKDATNIILEAINNGINVFDTADSYSLGNSERRLGKIIKENRDEIHIFTKGGNIPTYDLSNPVEIDLSYHHLISALNRSLKRLQTNYVDLFQAHKAPQKNEDFDELEKTFNELKSTGKAKFCGVSVGREYNKGIELIERGLVDTLQLHLSLLDFEAIEQLLPIAKKNNVGIIASEPLAQGFLTGKYTKNHIFPKEDVRTNFERKIIEERISKSREFLFLESNEKTLSQSALSYLLQLDGVSICIPGAKSIQQLKSNIDAVNVQITKNELKKITEIHKEWKESSFE
jgi:aryl-alcohol dehydrogenase-like predicted oxidoreductase